MDLGHAALGPQKLCQKGNAGLHSSPRAVNFQGPVLALPTWKDSVLSWTESCKISVSTVQHFSPWLSQQPVQHMEDDSFRLTQHFCNRGLCFMTVVSNRHQNLSPGIWECRSTHSPRTANFVLNRHVTPTNTINHRVQNPPSSLKAHLFHSKQHARTYRRNTANPTPPSPSTPGHGVHFLAESSHTRGLQSVRAALVLHCPLQMPQPRSSPAVTYMRSGLKRWMMAHRARPLFQELVRSVTLTFRYPSVCFWHHVRSLLGRMSDSAERRKQTFQSACACPEGHKC